MIPGSTGAGLPRGQLGEVREPEGGPGLLDHLDAVVHRRFAEVSGEPFGTDAVTTTVALAPVLAPAVLAKLAVRNGMTHTRTIHTNASVSALLGNVFALVTTSRNRQ